MYVAVAGSFYHLTDSLFFLLLQAMERRKKHIMASIQHNLQQAKSTGDDKRLNQVASRQKVSPKNQFYFLYVGYL